MGILRNFTDIKDNIQNGTADFLDKLGSETINFGCQLWNNFPDQITKNNSLSGSFARGVLNNVCGTGNVPPPPNSEFDGGQCPGVTYRLRYTQTSYNVDNCTDATGPIREEFLVGPVGSIGFQQTFTTTRTTNCNGASGEDLIRGNWIIEDATGIVNLYSNVFADPAKQADPPLAFITVIDLTRPDGLPDDCGEQPPEYPPTFPSSDDYTTNITINMEDGDTLNYDLTYAPTINNFPMEFNLGGINLSLNLGGINFDFGQTNSDGTNTNLPDSQPHPLPKPLDETSDFRWNPSQPAPNAEDYDEIEKTDTDEPEDDVGIEVEYLVIEITQKPSNAQVRDGAGAPNVTYAGWFEWKTEDAYFPREHITFNKCTFSKPDGATGYAYTMYNGFRARATIYKRKVEE